jgi:alkyl sulfatase BDS1-like metallo-beta-lactamase superfamily hydrolase
VPGKMTFERAVGTGEVHLKDNRETAKEFFSMLDTFLFWLNIVTP